MEIHSRSSTGSNGSMARIAAATRMRARQQQQRIAVRRLVHYLRRGEHAACAGLVLNHHGLAETLGQAVSDQPGRGIGATAGAKPTTMRIAYSRISVRGLPVRRRQER